MEREKCSELFHDIIFHCDFTPAAEALKYFMKKAESSAQPAKILYYQAVINFLLKYPNSCTPTMNKMKVSAMESLHQIALSLDKPETKGTVIEEARELFEFLVDTGYVPPMKRLYQLACIYQKNNDIASAARLFKTLVISGDEGSMTQLHNITLDYLEKAKTAKNNHEINEEEKNNLIASDLLKTLCEAEWFYSLHLLSQIYLEEYLENQSEKQTSLSAAKNWIEKALTEGVKQKNILNQNQAKNSLKFIAFLENFYEIKDREENFEYLRNNLKFGNCEEYQDIADMITFAKKTIEIIFAEKEKIEAEPLRNIRHAYDRFFDNLKNYLNEKKWTLKELEKEDLEQIKIKHGEFKKSDLKTTKKHFIEFDNETLQNEEKKLKQELHGNSTQIVFNNKKVLNVSDSVPNFNHSQESHKKDSFPNSN